MADRFSTNNTYRATAVVPGRPRVLLVDADPDRVTSFARALDWSGAEALSSAAFTHGQALARSAARQSAYQSRPYQNVRIIHPWWLST